MSKKSKLVRVKDYVEKKRKRKEKAEVILVKADLN